MIKLSTGFVDAYSRFLMASKTALYVFACATNVVGPTIRRAFPLTLIWYFTLTFTGMIRFLC